jgi:hypothetical protein
MLEGLVKYGIEVCDYNRGYSCIYTRSRIRGRRRRRVGLSPARALLAYPMSEQVIKLVE